MPSSTWSLEERLSDRRLFGMQIIRKRCATRSWTGNPRFGVEDQEPFDGHGNNAPLAVIAKAVKASLLRAKLGIVTIHEDLKISHHAFAVP